MSDERFVNISRLMTSYNFEIEELPDNLKCVKCKMVLKNACQVPCACRFCRTCIDEMRAQGSEFCPGVSEECRESLLLNFESDYLANQRVARLMAKCPHDGCVHKCQLANMEEHLKQCQRRCVKCPFREWGCKQDRLTVAEMDEHLQRQIRWHSDILIGIIANVNRKVGTLKERDEISRGDIEMLKNDNKEYKRKIEILKQKDQDNILEIEEKGKNNQKDIGTLSDVNKKSIYEIEVMKQKDKDNQKDIGTLKDESKKNRDEKEVMKQKDEDNIKKIEMLIQESKVNRREIETLKKSNENRKREIEGLKCESVVKDGQIKSIMDQLMHVNNENKSIKENREDLVRLVHILSEKLKQGLDEVRDNDEIYRLNVIEHVDREIGIISDIIGSKNEPSNVKQPVKDNIQSKCSGKLSIKDDLHSMMSQLQSIQAVVGLVDVRYDWVIIENVAKTAWNKGCLLSTEFIGQRYPYKYQLMSWNGKGELWLYLRICPGPSDEKLGWPFQGRVVITVADRTRPEACKTISRHCKIDRPGDRDGKTSDYFKFCYSELIELKLDLSQGVCVSSAIVPGATQ